MSLPPTPPGRDDALARGVRLRLAAALVALGVGAAALVVAVLLVRSTLA
jgi:hypothetical protein